MSRTYFHVFFLILPEGKILLVHSFRSFLSHIHDIETLFKILVKKGFQYILDLFLNLCNQYRGAFETKQPKSIYMPFVIQEGSRSR